MKRRPNREGGINVLRLFLLTGGKKIRRDVRRKDRVISAIGPWPMR